ncbi:M48 family metallopeptidase [Desulfovibrio inopinatus]|uniref:M48 family metallopeptidase n=1 Tax=Desulfovibrio inopinatus TaxID=102109 RepID=UPI00041B3A2B|nr:M48 family metallopeptidase [Desulfovibrio inopinatus]
MPLYVTGLSPYSLQMKISPLYSRVRRLHVVVWVVICLLVGMAGCAQAPYTGRSQLILLDKEQEMLLGMKASEEVKRTERLSTDARRVALVNRVGRRIAAGAARPEYQWEFYVVANDTPNAFALPGGKVYVYEGMFKYARTENQLATVMAHEIAHVIARHGVERMSSQMALSLGGDLAGLMVSGGDAAAFNTFQQLYGFGSQVAVGLPHSRSQESEADRIGLILMAKAGYDPRSALSFWQNMLYTDTSQLPFFLSTHPTDEERIADLVDDMPEAMQYYTPVQKEPRSYLPGAFDAPYSPPSSGYQPYRY